MPPHPPLSLRSSLPNLSIYFTNWIRESSGGSLAWLAPSRPLPQLSQRNAVLGISSAPLTMVINLVLRGVAVWWLKGGEGYPGEAKFIVGLTGWQSANFSLRIPVLLIMCEEGADEKGWGGAVNQSCCHPWTLSPPPSSHDRAVLLQHQPGECSVAALPSTQTRRTLLR